jgi:hypothetical protein
MSRHNGGENINPCPYLEPNPGCKLRYQPLLTELKMSLRILNTELQSYRATELLLSVHTLATYLPNFRIVLTNSMEQNPSSELNNYSAGQENPPVFYGTRNFIAVLTRAYPEPDEFSPHLRTYFFKINFNILKSI